MKRATSHGPQVADHGPLSKTPTPNLPQGEGALLLNKLRATVHSVIITTYHAPRTTYPRADTWVRPYGEITHITSHKLQATCRFSPIPRTRPDALAELRGPCRKRSRVSVVVDAQMLERRGRFETFPYRLRAEKLSMVFLLATGHEPLVIPSPSPRTTNHEPIATHGSAPATR